MMTAKKLGSGAGLARGADETIVMVANSRREAATAARLAAHQDARQVKRRAETPAATPV